MVADWIKIQSKAIRNQMLPANRPAKRLKWHSQCIDLASHQIWQTFARSQQTQVLRTLAKSVYVPVYCWHKGTNGISCLQKSQGCKLGWTGTEWKNCDYDHLMASLASIVENAKGSGCTRKWCEEIIKMKVQWHDCGVSQLITVINLLFAAGLPNTST